MLQEYTQLIVTQTLMNLGLTAGEISQRQARKTYGKWFDIQVQNGRIKPVRMGHTIYYQLTDILAAKAEDKLPATLL